MKQLREQIKKIIEEANIKPEIIEEIKKERSISIFSTEGRILTYLLSKNIITYEKYLEISNDFSHRNKYWELYEMGPRPFGQIWCENHIHELFPEFIKANKKNMASRYLEFQGEFDLWLDGIRVEIKASKAAGDDKTKKESIANRAYSRSEANENSFKYHFQQVKPKCADVFICIGVCKAEIIYWVITSKELVETDKLSSQHRNENTGIKGIGVYEGQFFATEEKLKPYLVEQEEILDVVKKVCGR